MWVQPQLDTIGHQTKPPILEWVTSLFSSEHLIKRNYY